MNQVIKAHVSFGSQPQNLVRTVVPFTTDGRVTPERALAKKNLPSSRAPTVRQLPITGAYYFKFVDSRTLVFPGASPCLSAGGRAFSGVRRLVGGRYFVRAPAAFRPAPGLRPSAGPPSAPSGTLARSAFLSDNFINKCSNLFFYIFPRPVVKEYRIRFGIRILEPQKASEGKKPVPVIFHGEMVKAGGNGYSSLVKKIEVKEIFF